MSLETSLFAFASDVDGEGIATVLDNVEGRAGVQGVSIAVAYHEARDVFPHAPVGKVRFHEEGALFFRPNPVRWSDCRLRPPVSELVRDRDLVAELQAEANRRGVAVHAWTVFLHNGALARMNPECAPVNAYGDRYVTDLCPANPDVRTYARVLAAEVAGLGVRSIVAESLHYHPFDHGHAHERCFIELGPRARYLLGLCFCQHCLRAAKHRGVDGERVRSATRAVLDPIFASGVDGSVALLDAGELESAAGGHFAGYREMREQVVTSLVAEVADSARAEGDAALVFIDLSGALAGDDGLSGGAPASSLGWQLGIDVSSVGESMAIEILAYARDPERVRVDLESYRKLIGEAGLQVVLRPMRPDCASARNLQEKVEIVREAGVNRLDFYHYGFMPLTALDWIRHACGGR